MEPLYDPTRGRMRVAGLMSGSGSNLRKIIEHSENAPYKVVVIFSDNPASNAQKIGKEYGIPVVVRDISAFYRAVGKPRKDLAARAEFDSGTVGELMSFGVDVAAYAGYMSIATPSLVNAFLGINVHPADLSIVDGDRRKYTGDHAVRDAIISGERELRASTHIIEPTVDYGRILMISTPIQVSLPELFDAGDKKMVELVADLHQKKLKEVGDWVIFPKTLEYIASGRYSRDGSGKLFFDGGELVSGLRL